MRDRLADVDRKSDTRGVFPGLDLMDRAAERPGLRDMVGQQFCDHRLASSVPEPAGRFGFSWALAFQRSSG
jgi:hypothetical protein